MRSTLTTFIVIVSLSGCYLFRAGPNRIKHDRDLVQKAAQSVRNSDLTIIHLDSLSRGELKTDLKKIKAEKARVFYTAPHSFYHDSTIVFSRFSFLLTIEEVIFDFSISDRDLGKDGLEKIHDRIYYRSYVPIS